MPILIVLFLMSVAGASAQTKSSARSPVAGSPGAIAAAVDAAPAISPAQPAADPGSLLQQAAGFLASVLTQNYLEAVIVL